jgi:hypothetical protein
MGISYPVTPRIYNFPPPTHPTASECTHPPATSGIVVIYLLVPPTPCSTALPYHTPPPSHPAPSAYPMPYPLTQRCYLSVLYTPPQSSGGLHWTPGDFLESRWTPPELYLNLHIYTKYTWSPGELHLNSR